MSTNSTISNVFKWLVIPWIQAELDAYAASVNRTKKRHQPHKVTPQGAPDDIIEYPEEYGCTDFRVRAAYF